MDTIQSHNTHNTTQTTTGADSTAVMPVSISAGDIVPTPKRKNKPGAGRPRLRMLNSRRWRTRFITRLINNGGLYNLTCEKMKVSKALVLKERQNDPDFDQEILDAMREGKIKYKQKMEDMTSQLDLKLGEKLIEKLESGEIEIRASDILKFLSDKRGSKSGGGINVQTNIKNENNNEMTQVNQNGETINNDQSVNIYLNLPEDELRQLKKLTEKALRKPGEIDPNEKVRIERTESANRLIEQVS